MSGPSTIHFGQNREAPGIVAEYPLVHVGQPGDEVPVSDLPEDRKSTRLNSSHANISYAVFCLKKNEQRPAAEAPAPDETSTEDSPLASENKADAAAERCADSPHALENTDEDTAKSAGLPGPAA